MVFGFGSPLGRRDILSQHMPDGTPAPLFGKAPASSFVHQQEIRPGCESKSNRLCLAPIQRCGQFHVGLARNLNGEPGRFCG